MSDMWRFLTSAICLIALGGLGSPAAAQTGLISANKGAVSLVTLTETTASTTTSTIYVDLASTSVTIPAGQMGYVLASFSAEAKCTGGLVCLVRILVDGVETHPKMEDDDLRFMTPGDLYWESQSIDRISDELPAGTHSVTVQWAVVGNSSRQFWLDDWQLKAVVWRSR